MIEIDSAVGNDEIPFSEGAATASEMARFTDEWFKPSEARRMLMATGVSPVDVESMFAHYLRHGDLRASAAAMWKSDERFTSAAWRNKPEETTSGPIPQRYWRLEKAILEDRAQWRVSANRFLATTRLKPRRRFMMQGVRFYLPDLRRLQPSVFGAEKTKPKRGRPVATKKQDAAWMAALELILQRTSEDIEIDSIGAFTLDLEQFFEGSTTPDRPSQHQLRPVASAAYGVLYSLGRLRSK